MDEQSHENQAADQSDHNDQAADQDSVPDVVDHEEEVTETSSEAKVCSIIGPCMIVFVHACRWYQ